MLEVNLGNSIQMPMRENASSVLADVCCTALLEIFKSFCNSSITKGRQVSSQNNGVGMDYYHRR